MGFGSETRARIDTYVREAEHSRDVLKLEDMYARLVDLRTQVFCRPTINMNLLDSVNDALQTLQSRIELLRVARPRGAPCTPLCLRTTSVVSGAFLLVVYFYSILRYYGTV